jgi:uncharacterized protein (DUF885 family)
LGQTRREAMAMLATGLATSGVLTGTARAFAAIPGDAQAALLALLPEAAVRASIVGGDWARRCDDPSPEGSAALALAIAAAQRSAPPGDLRALLDRAATTSGIPYGRNDPLAAIHRPYGVTPFTGPHIDTPAAMRLIQPIGTAEALDAWQAKLGAYADALLGLARSLRADEAAGCVPPATLSRATLIQMDAFILVPAERHPLVLALGERASADAAKALTIAKRVQPAMALVRDTLAGITRRGRAEPGVWTQPQGDILHAANFARAGDTIMSPTGAQDYAREETKRIGALLDRRLAARGFKQGTLAERIGGLFAAHPGLVASDDAEGRAALLEAARSRLVAAQVILPKLLPHDMTVATVPDLHAVPDAGHDVPGGSFYLPAGFDGARPAALWLDTRSVFALPVPGVSPLAFHLGLPGEHLAASLAPTDRPLLARMAAWPASTDGWACYAERLAADEGLFARDPFGDIARLSDELLRAARLVADVGLHAQRWTRARAEAEMTTMTGAAQGGSIDRIIAMPGEAASYTLGLKHVIDLRDAAKKAGGKAFDIRAFHGALLSGGPRPFASVSAG